MIVGVAIAFSPFPFSLLAVLITREGGYMLGLYALMITIPVGMIVAATGGIVFGVQKSRAARNSALTASWAAPSSATPAAAVPATNAVAIASQPAETTATPTPSNPPVTSAGQSNSKLTSSLLLVIGIAIFIAGIGFNATRNIDTLGETSSAFAPIDGLWLGLLITTIGAAKARVAFTLPGAPAKYSTAQALLWAGIFCIAWSPLVWVGMAVPVTAEFVNLSLDPGGLADSTAFSTFSGGGSGPFMSAFTGSIVGIALILWSSKVTRKAMSQPT